MILHWCKPNVFNQCPSCFLHVQLCHFLYFFKHKDEKQSFLLSTVQEVYIKLKIHCAVKRIRSTAHTLISYFIYQHPSKLEGHANIGLK